jgi:plastocyanin
MTATPPSWRVAVKAGDVLRVSATYDSSRGSWYESMGIMVVWMADTGAGADPFQTNVNVPGQLTHGHLAENDHHGGEPAGLPDARTLPTVAAPDHITIDSFTYSVGDTSEGNRPIPQLRQGQPVRFDNLEAGVGKGIWHTITACNLPCNGATGIASPLADADVPFDSGELGTGGAPTADRTTWPIPTSLTPGTYSYFCRIHPFMRGAFQVTAS